MTETHITIEIFVILLLVTSIVSMATRWLKVPYPPLLVIVGLVLSRLQLLPAVHLSPDLILLIFLPALLFEASWNLNLRDLRVDLIPILILSFPGVVVSLGVIGVLLHFTSGLPWLECWLFGAIISATDPISVFALFRKLGVPHRLAIIVGGESLFNDGTAAVLFQIIMGIIGGAGIAAASSTLLLHSLREFERIVFGGIAVGFAIGFLASRVTRLFDDHLLEITLTTIAAYGSFLVADALHVSPVLAILVCGLVIGNFGRREGMSGQTQVAVNAFWEYAAFAVNSLVFLLIGIETNIDSLWNDARLIGWSVFAMLGARMIVVYGLVPISNAFSKEFPFRWRHILVWGGLRGALALALVLSLPDSLAFASQMKTLVFGAVLFSLLLQGFTLEPFLRLVNVAENGANTTA